MGEGAGHTAFCIPYTHTHTHTPQRAEGMSQSFLLILASATEAKTEVPDSCFGAVGERSRSQPSQKTGRGHGPTCLSPGPLHLQARLVPVHLGHNGGRTRDPPLNPSSPGPALGLRAGPGMPPPASSSSGDGSPHAPPPARAQSWRNQVCCPTLSRGRYFLQVLTWHGITQRTSLTDSSPSHAEPLHDGEKI